MAAWHKWLSIQFKQPSRKALHLLGWVTQWNTQFLMTPEATSNGLVYLHQPHQRSRISRHQVWKAWCTATSWRHLWWGSLQRPPWKLGLGLTDATHQQRGLLIPWNFEILVPDIGGKTKARIEHDGWNKRPNVIHHYYYIHIYSHNLFSINEV